LVWDNASQNPPSRKAPHTELQINLLIRRKTRWQHPNLQPTIINGWRSKTSNIQDFLKRWPRMARPLHA
jgi:hypothetical protein